MQPLHSVLHSALHSATLSLTRSACCITWPLRNRNFAERSEKLSYHFQTLHHTALAFPPRLPLSASGHELTQPLRKHTCTHVVHVNSLITDDCCVSFCDQISKLSLGQPNLRNRRECNGVCVCVCASSGCLAFAD